MNRFSSRRLETFLIVTAMLFMMSIWRQRYSKSLGCGRIAGLFLAFFHVFPLFGACWASLLVQTLTLVEITSYLYGAGFQGIRSLLLIPWKPAFYTLEVDMG
jgi:hypothetical protein